MKNIIKYTALAILITSIVSCEDLFNPINENRLTSEYIETDPTSAEGILLQGYQGIISHTDINATATDDAVSNNINDGYKRMATGQLSARSNQAQRWDRYSRIFYLNKFINIIENKSVRWNADDTVNLLFEQRLLGEALAMRGLYHFYILQAHAGKNSSGELLGIPYYKDFISKDGNFNIPRPSFEETLENINADLDSAIALLPMDYSNNKKDLLPKFEGYDFEKYKLVNGTKFKLRISGRIVNAIQSAVGLFAASPAFLNGQGHYEKAANIASEIINLYGGVGKLNTAGLEFYKSDGSFTGTEFIWGSSIEGEKGSSWLENQNYPPSVNGSGDINPSHNLVSAFPMANGYPATEANGYDPQNPYANRDPRLKMFIVTNGDEIYTGATIKTGVGGKINRIDSIVERSTLTGYYMKKLLRNDVRINNDGSVSEAKHASAYFRYTELFLILAEAANEIGGPDYAVNGITARAAIGAIRKRAGISQPDNYMASLTTKEDFRELIRNERRIELCFEGHRFWDLRRWDLNLEESVKGYFHNGSQYDEILVETRKFPSKYLPIPNDEILRFPALVQNEGW